VSTSDASTSGTRDNFIYDIIDEDLEEGTYGDRVVTRFPPEPNGYLHIGHAKSIVLNFGIKHDYADQADTRCHLRFDDTNPETESTEYVDSIKDAVQWLGYDWEEHEYYASDYFEQFYQYAIKLIKQGDAYVDSLSVEEIREYRGTVEEPGKPSPYRDRSVEENLELFRKMKAGEFEDGEHVLRAKIDMSSPHMIMRDPLLFRIKHAHHYRQGDDWCIYPMYDYAHPLEDAIEDVTHSLCTLEFDNNRRVYDWVMEHCLDEEEQPSRPRQYEFNRLNLGYTVMSKTKLRHLIEEGLVGGWDDPRLPTISGLRRRGVPPSAIRSFCREVGVTRSQSRVQIGHFEHALRDDLNPKAPRVMARSDTRSNRLSPWTTPSPTPITADISGATSMAPMITAGLSCSNPRAEITAARPIMTSDGSTKVNWSGTGYRSTNSRWIAVMAPMATAGGRPSRRPKRNQPMTASGIRKETKFIAIRAAFTLNRRHEPPPATASA